MAQVNPIPSDVRDLPELVVAINERIDEINQDFQNMSGSSHLSVSPPQEFSGNHQEGNAFALSNPDINVYDFLDPLFTALRENALLVSQAQVQVNAIGNLQLQVDSISANKIQAGAITAVAIAAGSITTPKLAASAVTADKISVSQLSAISANLGTITAGNMTLDSSGFIRGGATAYNTGVGFWLGYNSGVYKFFVGDAGGNKLLFDGSNLTITGSITATTGTIGGWTVNATTLTGGSTTLNSNGTITCANLIASTAGTVGGWTLGATTLTGGSVTIDSAGNIRAGQTAYNTGTGFWSGVVTGTPKFSIGNSSGQSMTWDGTTMTVTGSITVSGGNAAKIDLSNVTGFYAGSPGVGGAANTIVNQGALAILNAAAWASQITGRPTELTDGRIPAALNSSGIVISAVTPGSTVTTGGSGLYLGSDFMGYYNGAAWKTYMDNSGNFYLGGTSGSLQWNGTTLSVVSGNLGGAGVVTISSSGLNVGTSGHVLGGQTAYNTGTGFFLGYESAAYKFSIGDASSNYLTWNGTTMSLAGTLTATSGTIGGFTIGATTLTASDFVITSSGGSTGMVFGTTTANNHSVINMSQFGVSVGTNDYYFEIVRNTTVRVSVNDLINRQEVLFSAAGFLTRNIDDTLSSQMGIGFFSMTDAAGTSSGIMSIAASNTWSLNNNMAIGGNLSVITFGKFISCTGASGVNGGIKYNGGAGNAIAFTWDGSNVKVFVDGAAQGTIPNP